MLQPSLLFSILSRGWGEGGGLIERVVLLQNLTAKGGGGLSRAFTVILFSINLKLYSPRYPVSAESHFSCVVYHVLARYSILFDAHI